MTSREQFEAWLRAQPHVLNVGVEQDGTYTLHEDRVAWEAWQASREAVEVVPDEIQKLKDGRGFKYVKNGIHYSVNYANGWNQCRAATLQAGNSPVTPDCSCRTCRPVTITDSRFVVCPECGNKRCPHANDHRNACTGSNDDKS